jgi:hypothetical protein
MQLVPRLAHSPSHLHFNLPDSFTQASLGATWTTSGLNTLGEKSAARSEAVRPAQITKTTNTIARFIVSPRVMTIVYETLCQPFIPTRIERCTVNSSDPYVAEQYHPALAPLKCQLAKIISLIVMPQHIWCVDNPIEQLQSIAETL